MFLVYRKKPVNSITYIILIAVIFFFAENSFVDFCAQKLPHDKVKHSKSEFQYRKNQNQYRAAVVIRQYIACDRNQHRN